MEQNQFEGKDNYSLSLDLYLPHYVA